MVRFALIGTGWRALFYLRIAHLVPERFCCTGVLTRSTEKGVVLAAEYGLPAVQSLSALLQTAPDFVVVSVKRGTMRPYLSALLEADVPALIETPPAENWEELLSLWKEVQERQGRIQVAEQYFLQPLYAAWHHAVTDGLLGEVQNMSLSALHGCHAISILRRMLGVGFAPCTVWGERHTFPVTQTDGRDGPKFDGTIIDAPRDRVTFAFQDGQRAFFDFSPVQYHSFIRTRQLNIQGTRGEIDDLTIRYLTEENLPVTQTLTRVDQGPYGNAGMTHVGMMLGDRFVYRSPLPGARLSDDELAVASLLLGMKRMIETGEEIYPLADALQDMALWLTMNDALEAPLTVVRSRRMPWQER